VESKTHCFSTSTCVLCYRNVKQHLAALGDAFIGRLCDHQRCGSKIHTKTKKRAEFAKWVDATFHQAERTRERSCAAV
jgi:hypothetical protein